MKKSSSHHRQLSLTTNNRHSLCQQQVIATSSEIATNVVSHRPHPQTCTKPHINAINCELSATLPTLECFPRMLRPLLPPPLGRCSGRCRGLQRVPRILNCQVGLVSSSARRPFRPFASSCVEGCVARAVFFLPTSSLCCGVSRLCLCYTVSV